MIIYKHIRNWKKEVRLKRTQRWRQNLKERGLEVDDHDILMILHQKDMYDGITTIMWLFLLMFLLNLAMMVSLVSTLVIP